MGQIKDLNDKALMTNLYFTQLMTLVLAVLIILWQKNEIWTKLAWYNIHQIGLWGCGFAFMFLALDVSLSRFVPKEVSDDGGVNDQLFGNRRLGHILFICIIVAFCEELLFRGAIQHAFGAYWTSVLFAAIHIRYLRHWIMTGLVFGVSYGLGLIYIQTGSLWTPILAHFLIDIAMGCMIRFRRDD